MTDTCKIEKKFRPYTVADYNAGKVLVYRNGEKPEEWHFFKLTVSHYPIYSVTPLGAILSHTSQGYRNYQDSESEWDLVIECEKREYWINVYRRTFGTIIVSPILPSLKEAVMYRLSVPLSGCFIGDPIKIYEEYI